MNVHPRPRQNVATAIVGSDINDLPTHLEADRQKLRKTLDTANVAAGNAIKGIPSSNATEPDAFENQLSHLAEAKIAFYREDAEGLLDGLSEELHQNEVHPFNIEAVPVLAQRAVDLVKAEHVDRLQDACDQEYEAGIHLRNFRRQHEQSLAGRPPTYGDDWFLSVLVVLAVLCFEVLGNSQIVEPHIKGGLLEAWTICIAVSAVNIVFGFLGGYAGLRYFKHGIGAAKYAGFAVTFMCCFVGLVLNIQFARFRDALEFKGQGTWGDFHWLQAPSTALDFHSLISFALFLLGIACFLLAMWKGFGGKHTTFDPCPGYAAADRRHRQAKANLSAVTADIRDRVQAALDVLISTNLHEHIDVGKRHCVESRRIANTALERASERLDKAKDYITVTNSERRYYREVVAYTRGPNWERPPYFRHFPTYAEMLAAFPTPEHHVMRAADAEEIYKKNIAAIGMAERELVRLASIELQSFFDAIEAMRNRAREHFHEQYGAAVPATMEMSS